MCSVDTINGQGKRQHLRNNSFDAAQRLVGKYIDLHVGNYFYHNVNSQYSSSIEAYTKNPHAV